MSLWYVVSFFSFWTIERYLADDGNQLNYIYHNYQNPITLSQISKVGKISIAQCYRDFKNIIKMSPYEKY